MGRRKIIRETVSEEKKIIETNTSVTMLSCFVVFGILFKYKNIAFPQSSNIHNKREFGAYSKRTEQDQARFPQGCFLFL